MAQNHFTKRGIAIWAKNTNKTHIIFNKNYNIAYISLNFVKTELTVISTVLKQSCRNVLNRQNYFVIIIFCKERGVLNMKNANSIFCKKKELTE